MYIDIGTFSKQKGKVLSTNVITLLLLRVTEFGSFRPSLKWFWFFVIQLTNQTRLTHKFYEEFQKNFCLLFSSSFFVLQ